MTDENIKSFTMAQIREMIRRGEYMPTAADAPEYDFDDSFWTSAHSVREAGKTAVTLELDTEAVEQFRRAGPDYLDTMAKVLNEHARKAS